MILHHLARRLPERWRQTLRAWTTYQRRRRSVTEHGYSLQCFDEYRCIYYHIPKTAGLSVCQGLFGHHGPGHIDARTYRLIFGRAHFEKYFRFTFVRNPWDRLVSAYHFLQAGGLDREDRAWAKRHLGPYPDFPTFVRRGLTPSLARSSIHLRPQVDWLTVGDDFAVDFVGRFEHLNRDFAHVADTLGIDAALPHVNRSRRDRDYRMAYDETTRDIVRSIYMADVDRFDYTFEAKAPDDR